MKMELRTGRPEDISGRLEREIKVYELLEKLGIEYQQVDHEAANTMEACEEVDKILGVQMCKNLFLCNRQKTNFYLLLMPGNKPFKTKDLSKQINSARLSFAEPEFMEEFLDIKPGAVSVMGLMNDSEKHVQLLIDKPVAEEEYIGCHPCVNTSSVKLKIKDLLEVFLPNVNHEPIVVELPWPER